MAPMKRPAASSVGGATKKAAKAQDPLASKCEEIAEMVNAAEAVPENVRAMLNAVMHHSLLVPKDKRHPMQEECVGMIGEVLAAVQTGLLGKVEALQAKLADSDTEKSAREGAAETAAELLKQKTHTMEVAKDALGEAVASSGKAHAEHKAALLEQKLAEDGYAAAEGKKAILEAASKGDFESLKEGGGNAKAVRTVLKVAKDFGFEQQLIVAAEKAFLKPPADRGSFDNMVFQQFEEQFSNFIAAFSAEMTNCEANKGECAAKVESAAAKTVAVDEKARTCREEFSAAQVACADAEGARSKAHQALKDLVPEMRSAAAALQDAQNELKGGEAVVATFKDLAERTEATEVTIDADRTDGVEVAEDAGPELAMEVAPDECVEAAE